MGACIRGFGARHCAQTRRQVPVTQRDVKTLEGKPLDTTLIALLQFPSAEAAEAFVNDPEYAPHAAARQGGSEPLLPDRRHRSCRNNSLSTKRMISRDRRTDTIFNAGPRQTYPTPP